MPAQQPFRVDPFYDQAGVVSTVGAPLGSPPVTRPGVAGSTTASIVTPGGGVGYRDIQDGGQLATGQHVAAAAGTGPRGIRGCIIPTSSGGTPQGFNPHDLHGLVMHVDPLIPGQSVCVPLGDISPGELRAANAQGHDAVQDGAAQDPRVVSRLRAAASFHSLMNGDNIRPVAEDTMVPQANAPAAANGSGVVRVIDGDPQQQPRRLVSPLAAFGQPAMPPQPAAQPAMRVVDSSRQLPTEGPAMAPQKSVLFDVPGFGNLQAHYHDVIVVPAAIVLSLDVRYQGNRFFPSPTSEAKVACQIGDQDVYYLVSHTGIRFTFRGYEIHILMIEDQRKVGTEAPNGEAGNYSPRPYEAGAAG